MTDFLYDKNSIAIEFAAVGRVRQCLEPGLGKRALDMRGERLNIRPRRDILKLRIVGKQGVKRDAFAHRQKCPPLASRVEPDEGVLLEAEAPRNPTHQRIAVVGNDAEMIAGAVGHAFGKLELDVPSRAVQRSGAL